MRWKYSKEFSSRNNLCFLEAAVFCDLKILSVCCDNGISKLIYKTYVEKQGFTDFQNDFQTLSTKHSSLFGRIHACGWV